MGTINGIFIYDGDPLNGATAKLWQITAFAAYTDSTATVQANPLAATDVECLTSNGGVFAVNDVIKMENECCLVYAISGNTLYIIRGWHQTAPAQHVQNTVIYDEAVTPPVQDDAEPGSGQQGGSVTTAVAYGGDGAYRFDAVPEMEYYASVEYAGHRSFIHHFVERNDVTPEQILLVAGDMVIRNGDTITRLPIDSNGKFLKIVAGLPAWATVAPGATLTVAETEVFDGTAPQAWTDLDLSGTVGANAALVLLKTCADNGAILDGVAFRKNGDTDEFHIDDPSDPAGCALMVVGPVNIHFVAVAVTDNAGKIEWQARNANDCTIDVMAYIK